MKVHLVLLAAGLGTRFGSLKQLEQIHGRSVLWWSYQALTKALDFESCSLVCPKTMSCNEFLELLDWDFTGKVVVGGAERSDSVRLALTGLQASDQDLVVVHDAARPLLSSKDAKATLAAASNHAVGAYLAAPVTSTLRRVYGLKSETVSRDALYEVMTPQISRYKQLLNALEHCQKAQISVTDDVQALELIGHFPVLVSGSKRNFKITHPDDLSLAAALLEPKAAL